MILIKGVPLRHIEGIALWPFVLVKSTKPSERILRHEKIHLRQQLEMLILPFYIWYAIEWGIKCFKYKNPEIAYFNLGFEREAYGNEHRTDYLKTRKFWNFIAYL
jgi:hypothetical protein